MILSVSRRTDIPSFYLDWFLNRLREGWLLVRNPFNPSQVSRVPLSPSVIECIVFWTKNPEPLLMKLDQLKPYRFYIQFTVNPYGKDLESRLPELGKRLDVFRELSRKLGSERMVWRYSPVILNHIHSAESHCAAFNTVARALSGFTEECKLSFLEMYAKIRSRMGALGVVERGDAETLALAGRFAELAEKNSIRLSACGKPDLRPAGIPVSSCIDGALIQRITGKAMSFKKDPGQRGVCACVESVDVGSYQTCLNGCAYCYANHSHAAATRKAACYDPESPFLCDTARPGDVITDRAIRMHGATGGQQLRLTL